MKIENVDFKRICPACARCCKVSPILLPEERSKLIEKLNLSSDDFRDRGGVYQLKNARDGCCPFLWYGKCRIQCIKPIDCKIWPVYFIPMGERFDIALGLDCPITEQNKIMPEFVEFARNEIMKIPEKLRTRMYFVTLSEGFLIKPLKEIKIIKDAALEAEYRFGAVEEGKLYRSRQFYKNFLEYLREVYGIKTIINLRGDLENFEKEFAEKNNIKIIRIIMSPYKGPTDEELGKFFETVDNPENHPVLIHCLGGVDRTGVMAAIYRIKRQGWSVNDAKKEMEDYGHMPFFHPGMFEYLDRIRG